jgi:hypothetical protein
VTVNERSSVLWSVVLGAVAGGVVGFLYLTDDGRRMRARLEPGLDDVVREVRRLRSSVDKARLAAEEGWGTVADLTRPPARVAGGWAGTGRTPRPF